MNIRSRRSCSRETHIVAQGQKVTLGITIAYLSLSRHTFDQKELLEVTRDDNEAAVIGRYHSVICDALTGKVYAVTDRKFDCEFTSHPERTEPEPPKVIYFEYLERKAPYSHLVCQMEDQGLSPQERRGVTDAHQNLSQLADSEPSSRAARSRPAFPIGGSHLRSRCYRGHPNGQSRQRHCRTVGDQRLRRHHHRTEPERGFGAIDAAGRTPARCNRSLLASR